MAIPLPNNLDDDVEAYLNKALLDINNREKDYITLLVPARPVEGKLYYFKSTGGPITSVGLWLYKGPSLGWVFVA